MESNCLDHPETNEISICASVASFPEFGDNFVSVEGILYNNNFQELLSSGGGEVSCGTESLTLYKSEPDPLESLENETLNVISNIVKTEQCNPQEVPEILNQNTPSPTQMFGEDEEQLRPPRHNNNSKLRNRKKKIINESVIIIPRILGSLEQHSNIYKSTKDVDYFVRQNIDEYLIRRGFRQPNDPLRPSIVMLPPEKARLNAISYGPQYEAQEITAEIEKFWKFYSTLKAENIKLSEQLKPILVPLLIHFYDECFLSGETSIALRLYTDFGNRFLQEDNTKDNYNILFTISKVSTIDEFEGNELIQYLRRKDFIFVVSNVIFERLKMFLCSTGCPALVNLFANRLIIQVEESEVKPNYEEISAAGRGEENSKSTFETNAESNHISDKLKSSVLTNLPTLSLYTTDKSPISGAVSSQASMLAYGMASSEIRISFTSKRILNDVNMERKHTRRKRRLMGDNQNTNIIEYSDQREETGKELPAINTLHGHTAGVCGLVFHPRARVLFSVSEDTKMKAWDLNEFECKTNYVGHTAPIWCVDQTASGHMLVTGSMDTTARIWVPERTDYLRMLAGHYFDVDCVQFHPNEAYVATGSIDKSVRLWSVADGNLVRVFTGMNSPISSIQFHENGRYLIGASEDPTILIWDIAESEVIAEIPSPPFCLDISLNGNMLSACFSNNTVLIWNIFPIVGGSGDAYNCVPMDEQTYKIRSPKTYECTEQSKSLIKLFYRDPDNLYCLGETSLSSQNNREVRKTYKRNPLTEGILAKPNQNNWDESDSDSGSEMTNEELISQVTRTFNYDDNFKNDEDGNNVELNINEDTYQFCS